MIEILISTVYGIPREKKVDAVVFGKWAVHRLGNLGAHDPLPSPGHGWRVTHAPSGFAASSLADDLTRADAVRVAKALDRHLPDFPDPDWRSHPMVPVDPWAYLTEAVVAEALCVRRRYRLVRS